MTHSNYGRVGFASDSTQPGRPRRGPRVDVSRVRTKDPRQTTRGQVPSATFALRPDWGELAGCERAPSWRREASEPRPSPEAADAD